MRITVKELKQLIREAVEEELGSSEESPTSAGKKELSIPTKKFYENFIKARRFSKVTKFGSGKSDELVEMLESNDEALKEIYEFLKTNKSKHSTDLAEVALFRTEALASDSFEAFKSALIKKYKPTHSEGQTEEEIASAHTQGILRGLGIKTDRKPTIKDIMEKLRSGKSLTKQELEALESELETIDY